VKFLPKSKVESNLENKTVLITGATSGIGLNIVEQLIEKKCNIIAHGKSEEKLNQLKNGKGIISPSLQTVCFDLSIQNDFSEIVKNLPPIDGLVLNAGYVKLMPLQLINYNELLSIFNVNFFNQVLLFKELLKQKKINSGASIVFISSISTVRPTPLNAIYNSTKGAINAFVQSAAIELSKHKIRINAVLPGRIETEILNNQKLESETQKIHEMKYPLGRFGQPEDISKIVLFLLSDDSNWITGDLIKVDGGFSLHN